MDLVLARLDRVERKQTRPGAQIIDTDIGRLQKRADRSALGIDRSDRHSLVVQPDKSERPGQAVVSETVYRHRAGKRESPPVSSVEQILPRIVVTDRNQPASRKRRRIESVPSLAQRLAPPGAQIVPAGHRKHPLFPQRTAAVLAPVDHAVAQHRRRVDASGPCDPPLPARRQIDGHQTVRTVHVLFEREQRRAVEPHGRPVDGIARQGRRQNRGAVRLDGLRAPEAGQVVQRRAGDPVHRGPVILAQRPFGRQDRIRTPRPVIGHARPHVVAVSLPRPGHQLIAELVMVGNIVPVRPAEPLVERKPLLPLGQIGPVLDRKRRLKRAPERRHLRLGHHGVALEKPDRNEHRADETGLLPEHVPEPLHKTAVQIAVLHGMAVLVRH